MQYTSLGPSGGAVAASRSPFKLGLHQLVDIRPPPFLTAIDVHPVRIVFTEALVVWQILAFEQEGGMFSSQFFRMRDRDPAAGERVVDLRKRLPHLIGIQVWGKHQPDAAFSDREFEREWRNGRTIRLVRSQPVARNFPRCLESLD